MPDFQSFKSVIIIFFGGVVWRVLRMVTRADPLTA